MNRPTPPLNVLLIEDEALIVMDMQCAIEDAGHCVMGDVASVGQLGALDLPQHPDIAFIDLNLAEGSNGLDACNLVKQRWSDTYVVFVTANPKRIPVDFEGSHGVIAKPFTYSGLMQTIRYLSEGICAPPPNSSKPPNFVAFSNFGAA